MFNFLKIIILVLFLNLSAIAGNVFKNEAGNKYIQQFKNHAIKEMLLYNIPASIILAQGMLESGNGTSDLAVHANNHFGIKCHEDFVEDVDTRYSPITPQQQNYENMYYDSNKNIHLHKLLYFKG